MTDTLLELGGIQNWIGQRGNAIAAGMGSGRALGRHTTRLVANKLNKMWQAYLGSQQLQGTDQELADFISQYFGADKLNKLNDLVPNILPPEPEPAEAPPSPPAASGAPTPPPTGPMPGGAATPSTPQEAKVLQMVNAMLRDFSGRSDKAKGWVRNYMSNHLASYAQAFPALQQYVGGDPFTNVAPRRTPPPGAADDVASMTRFQNYMRRINQLLMTPTQPAAAQPVSPGAPGAPATQPSVAPGPSPATNLNIPPPPHPQQPPAFLRRQTSGRTITGNRLVEADPSLTIPPVQTARVGRRAPPTSTYTQPPRFMRQQTNPTQAPQSTPPSTNPAQAAAPHIIGRAQQDAIFVTLARMMIASGEATVGPPKGKGGSNTTARQPATQAAPGGGGMNAGRVLRAPVSVQAVEYAMSRLGGTMAQNDIDTINKFLATQPNQTATIQQVIGALAQNQRYMNPATMQMLIYATEYRA